MSDLSLQLQQAASQLPVSAYFDEALYAREMQNLFSRGPRYVGHRLAVPEMGNFHTLPQEHQGRALVYTPLGVWTSARPWCSWGRVWKSPISGTARRWPT